MIVFVIHTGENQKNIAEETVMKHMEILRKHNLPLTDREYSILAVCVTELEQLGHAPYQNRYPIQVDS